LLKAFSKIRVKFIAGFLFCLLVVGAFTAASYQHLFRMEEKLIRLNTADDMLNAILEVRRYEKNYLLYRKGSDYHSAMQYLQGLNALLTSVGPEIEESTGPETVAELSRLLQGYARSFAAVTEIQVVGGRKPAHRDELKDAIADIRASGQKIILLAEEVKRGERKQVKTLIDGYALHLGGFIIAITIAAAVAVFLMVKKIVEPLHIIEKATRVVAHGDFKPIPGGESDDEIGSLVRAFNLMVVQLQENREQMIQTEKLSALGTLTSGVAHELNNPLSNISTSCQILSEEMESRIPPYHQNLLQAIEEQVIKARDIVRALLEYSRDQLFRPAPVDLAEVVEDSLKLLKGQIPSKVEVQVHVPAGIVLDLDKTHMERALINLIMNAIQAMEAGGDLTIEGSVLPQSAGVKLSVSDTGMGIPSDIQPRIFDPFFTTKEVGRGTGMGLAITYGIIEQHGGRLHVESVKKSEEDPDAQSSVRKGSTFTIWLPERTETK
jgi:two-component system, NtrC family, sensor kinase